MRCGLRPMQYTVQSLQWDGKVKVREAELRRDERGSTSEYRERYVVYQFGEEIHRQTHRQTDRGGEREMGIDDQNCFPLQFLFIASSLPLFPLSFLSRTMLIPLFLSLLVSHLLNPISLTYYFHSFLFVSSFPPFPFLSLLSLPPLSHFSLHLHFSILGKGKGEMKVKGFPSVSLEEMKTEKEGTKEKFYEGKKREGKIQEGRN